MTTILAEISDKMPTIGQLWVLSMFFSFPVLLGIVKKWLSWLLLILASVFSIWLGYISFYEAFIEPAFADSVQSEMGEMVDS